MLAYAVIFSHSFYQAVTTGDPLKRWTQGQQDFGRMSVCFFFALSGYLIVQSWARDPDPARFLWKRILRIYPAYFLVSGLCFWVLQPMVSTHWTPNITAFTFSAARLTESPTGDMFYGTNYPKRMMGSAWTLPWEFACYVSVCLLGMIGALKYRRLLLAAAIVVVIVNALTVYGYEVPPRMRNDYGSWNGLLCIAYFIIGAAYFSYRDALKFTRWGVIISLLLLAASFLLGNFGAVLPVAGTYLFFALGFSTIRLPHLGGDYSYGVYLLGWPVAMIFVFFGWITNSYVLAAVTILCSTVLAVPLWHFVEKRCLALKSSRSSSHDRGPEVTLA